MCKRIVMVVALVASANDYDYLRGMRDTSTEAFRRWWRYRCDWVVLENAVAQATTDGRFA